MKATEQYSSIYSHVEGQLLSKLPPHLTYHSIDHTFDVLKQSERIARAENSFPEEDIFLLKVAALYHDTGFL
ncbi:HD domain-containing protein, partial [Halalkalibacter lacteus]|uniref:HD domain-containing protein n=1 Tax=Halalkalibacter lacteus TaxID=3090663 RepID=UPI003D66441E